MSEENEQMTIASHMNTIETYYIAEYQGIASHFISENRGEVVNWTNKQENPSDYQIHSFSADEWNLWVK